MGNLNHRYITTGYRAPWLKWLSLKISPDKREQSWILCDLGMTFPCNWGRVVWSHAINPVVVSTTRTCFCTNSTVTCLCKTSYMGTCRKHRRNHLSHALTQPQLIEFHRIGPPRPHPDCEPVEHRHSCSYIYQFHNNSSSWMMDNGEKMPTNRSKISEEKRHQCLFT